MANNPRDAKQSYIVPMLNQFGQPCGTVEVFADTLAEAQARARDHSPTATPLAPQANPTPRGH